jgi:hypothetical protein
MSQPSAIQVGLHFFQAAGVGSQVRWTGGFMAGRAVVAKSLWIMVNPNVGTDTSV